MPPSRTPPAAPPARRAASLKRCFELCALITSSLDLDEVLERIMTTSRQALEAETCSLLLTNPDTGDLVFTVAQGPVADKLPRGQLLRRGEGIAGWVQMTGEPALVQDAYADARFNPEFDRRTGYHTRSVLSVPLAVHGRIVGVASLINRADGQPFDNDDQEVFLLIAAQAAVAIENARLHQHLLARQRLEFDLEIAASVHNDLTPHGVPELPGFDVAGVSLSCDATGGDFHDFLPHPDAVEGGFSVVVADATGHGIAAALLKAGVRAYVRAMAAHGGTLTGMLDGVNRLMCQDTGQSGRFVTLLWLAVAPDGEIEYVKAGHDPALLYTPETHAFEELSARGVPLGVSPEWQYQPGAHPALTPGQVLVMGTDGIWECRNGLGEMFGKERLKQAVAHSAEQDADSILRTVLDTLDDFRGNQPRNDDVTLVVLKALGTQT